MKANDQRFTDGLVWKFASACLSQLEAGSRLSVSLFELCDEDLVHDLLVPSLSTSQPRRCIIREHPDKKGAYVKNLTETNLRSLDVLKVIMIWIAYEEIITN